MQEFCEQFMLLHRYASLALMGHRLMTEKLCIFNNTRVVSEFQMSSISGRCGQQRGLEKWRKEESDLEKWQVQDHFAMQVQDHVKEQGEILEGIVARIVSHESSKQMVKVLKDFPPPPTDGGHQQSAKSLVASPIAAMVTAYSKAWWLHLMKPVYLRHLGKAHMLIKR